MGRLAHHPATALHASAHPAVWTLVSTADFDVAFDGGGAGSWIPQNLARLFDGGAHHASARDRNALGRLAFQILYGTSHDRGKSADRLSRSALAAQEAREN